MKEEQYIDVSDLARLRDVKSIICDIVSSNSSIIEEPEFIEVIIKLDMWVDKLYEKVQGYME